MTILFLESGSDATHGLEFWLIINGTCASSTAQTKTGPRSISITGAWSASKIWPDTPSNQTAGRISYWAYFGGTPSGASNPTFAFNASPATTHFYIHRQTDGKLNATDGGTVRQTGVNVISNSVWHHIAIAWSRTSSSVNELRVWVDGVLEINLTNTTWTDPLSEYNFASGSLTSAAGYIDDVYIDDVADLSFPGDIRVTAKLPVALSTNNFDTAVGSGTNRYDRVSERPLSVTNGFQHAAATDVYETYGIQGPAAGDADISDKHIVAHMGWVYGKRGNPDGRWVRRIGEQVPAKSAHTTTVITSITATSSGDAIVVWFACDDNGNPGTTATCADSKGNTYAAGQSVQASATGSAAGVRSAIFVALNTTALAIGDTITVTHGSVTASVAGADEFAGLATSNALDVSSTNVQSNVAAPTSNATATLAQSEEVFLGLTGIEGIAGDYLNGTGRLAGYVTWGAGVSMLATSGGGAASNIGFTTHYEYTESTVGLAAGHTGSVNSRDCTTIVGAYKCQVGAVSVGAPKIVINGNETSLTLMTSNALYTAISSGSPYPASGAVTIGMRSSGTTADTFLYECGILVAWDESKGNLSNLRRRKLIDVRV